MKITQALRATAAELAAMSHSDGTIDHHMVWILSQRLIAQIEAFEIGLMEDAK